MTYTALARKWRPRNFAELTGQEHVLQALSNALASNRVHHAFLFTGTRGVGKTTIARILAKCLNCETGVTPTPCGVCAACREIDEGRFIDLIEVDAASRTKVDDTRELLDNVPYAPSHGRYKVYLIDEVHMLSTASFNALLKTLEEPPPHVKFLLATTDPQKVPVTVLSRCLQFSLKRLSVALISQRIQQILEAESVPFDQAAVRLVAIAADGSLRDGLSLLDQLIAFGGGRVEEPATRAMLGTVDRMQVFRLAELLAAAESAALLDYARTLEEWSPDYAQMLDALASLLVRVALKQLVPDYGGDELHEADKLAKLASRIGPEDIQLYYQTAILGRRDLQWAPDPRTGFEMTLLRMLVFRPLAELVVSGSSTPSRAASSQSSSRPARPAAGYASAGMGGSASPALGAGAGAAVGAESWATIVDSVELSGLSRQLATHCAWLGRDGVLLRLALDPRQKHLRTAAAVDRLAQGLSRHFGETLRVEIEVAEPPEETPARAEERAASEQLAAARESLEADPTVKALKEKFGATLRADTVRPHR